MCVKFDSMSLFATVGNATVGNAAFTECGNTDIICRRGDRG